MPMISVIVPVYRVEKYIHRCVDSILAQTFRDFELILVDDGSPDKCGAICDEYAAKDSRVMVIHQENQGVSVARNNGTKCAHSKWVMFVDSDDVIHPQMVELLFGAVKTSDIKLAMCGHIALEDTPASFYEPASMIYKECLIDETSLGNILCTGGDKYWVVWGKLLDREIVLKYPFPVGRIYEDNAVAYRWIYEAGEVADFDQKLYFYRQRQESIMHQKFSHRNIDYVYVLEQQLDFYRSLNYERMLSYISGMYIKTCSNLYRNVINHLGDKKTARILKKKLCTFYRTNKKYICLSSDEKRTCARDMAPYLCRLIGF